MILFRSLRQTSGTPRPFPVNSGICRIKRKGQVPRFGTFRRENTPEMISVMSGLAQACILPGTHVTSPPCLAYQSIFLDHPASLWPPCTSRRRPRTSCVSLVNAHISPPVAHHLDSLAFPSLAWSGLRAPIIHTFAPNHDAGNRP
uniref:Uncharacterized protein n=1 Tax=Caenorhabditis japonica TaxID=281687 RepID=A0A8R1IJZ4_CAEJA